MIKIIRYIPKITTARTQYREIDPDDMTWLKTEMFRWMAIMNELDQARDEDSRWVLEQWWHKRTKNLPSGKLGQNTPASFVGGLANNLVFGDQRDLSDKQMDALQNISHVLSGAFSQSCQSMRFQIGFE
jgi:hypothetical protein